MALGRVNVGSGQSVKSIQSGVSTIESNQLNITISSVDLSSTIILIRSRAIGDFNRSKFAGKLTSATNLNISRVLDPSFPNQVQWDVIEFRNVKSLQTGTFTQATSGTYTTSISSVDLTKSLAIDSKKVDSASQGALADYFKLNNSTTIEFECGQGFTSEWQVIEFL